eukprot:EG_transcript_24487
MGGWEKKLQPTLSFLRDEMHVTPKELNQCPQIWYVSLQRRLRPRFRKAFPSYRSITIAFTHWSSLPIWLPLQFQWHIPTSLLEARYPFLVQSSRTCVPLQRRPPCKLCSRPLHWLVCVWYWEVVLAFYTCLSLIGQLER